MLQTDYGLEEKYDKGRREGKQEGKIEGEVNGVIKGKLEVACNLKALGIALEVIMQTTGLSQDEMRGQDEKENSRQTPPAVRKQLHFL